MTPIEELVGIMARLRDPEDGCPWDREQDFASIAPYTIEEAYEVADAIGRGDMEDLRGELGDLLLQVVYHAQMASELGLFGFDDVARAISEKLVRRHPHVFGDARGRLVPAVRGAWEDAKAEERRARAARRGRGAGPFDDVPVALPALMRAAKVLGRARRVGLAEPGDEAEASPEDRVRAALDAARGDDPDARRALVGDLLFEVTRLARAFDVDPERALQERTRAFEERATPRD